MEQNIQIPPLEDEAVIAFKKEYTESNNIKKVSLLIDQLKDKNPAIRLYCAKKLTELGQILGPNRIEEELIPYITDLILNFEDNEEIFTEFSNQLLSLLTILQQNKIISFIGIRSLEILSGNDDEIVRQTSIDNLCKTIELLDEAIITQEIFPLMRRLIENDLKSKVSVCYLFPVVLPKIENEGIKKDLMQVFYDLSHDESPSVKRAAADNIKHFARTNDPALIDLVEGFYSYLINDTIDIVKIYTIESTKDLLMKLPENKRELLIIDFAKVVSLEKAWRVKYAASECICDICSFFSQSFNEQKFVPILMLFLKDKEPEVRSSVLAHFDSFVTMISTDKFRDSFFQIFTDLSNDSNIHVRSLYATCLLKCIKYFKGNETFLLESIMPLVTKVLKDENFEVQFAAISNIDELLFLSSDDVLMTKCFIPIITDGMAHTKWRFRLTIAEKLLVMVGKFTYEKYMEYFYAIIVKLYGDHADEIREVSWKIIEALSKLDKTLLKGKIWDLQKEKLESPKYIMRIAVLHSLQYFKEEYDNEFIINEVLPLIFTVAMKDKVPNVKFCSCKIVKDFGGFLINKRQENNKVLEKIETFLKSLQGDKDVDVKFFCNEAIQEISKLRIK